MEFYTVACGYGGNDNDNDDDHLHHHHQDDRHQDEEADGQQGAAARTSSSDSRPPFDSSCTCSGCCRRGSCRPHHRRHRALNARHSVKRATFLLCVLIQLQAFHLPMCLTAPIGSRGGPTFMEHKERGLVPAATTPSSLNPKAVDERSIEDRLLQDFGIAAARIGNGAIYYGGKKCGNVIVDLAKFADGRALDELIKPVSDYLHKESLKPNAIEHADLYVNEGKRVVVAAQEAVRIDLDITLERFGLRKMDGRRQKRELLTLAAVVIVTIIGYKVATKFASTIFGDEDATKAELQRLATDMYANQVEQFFKTNFGLHVKEARDAIRRNIANILTEMYRNKRLVKELFSQGDGELEDFLRKMVGSQFYDVSVYKEQPVLALELLEVQSVKPHIGDYELLVEVCAPMITRTMSHPIYVIQPVGEWKDDIYVEPILNAEHLIVQGLLLLLLRINSAFADLDSGDVLAPMMSSCSQLGDVHYCKDIRHLRADCNLEKRHGCEVQSFKRDRGREIVESRQVGSLHVIATTATEAEMVDEFGYKKVIHLPNRTMVMELPTSAIMFIDGVRIDGSSSISVQVSMKPTRFTSDLIIDHMMTGVFDPKFENLFNLSHGQTKWIGIIAVVVVAIVALSIFLLCLINKHKDDNELTRYIHAVTMGKMVKKLQKVNTRTKKIAEGEYKPGCSSAEPSDAEDDRDKMAKRLTKAKKVLGKLGSKKRVRDDNGEELELDVFKADYRVQKLIAREVRRAKEAKEQGDVLVEAAAEDGDDDEEESLKGILRRSSKPKKAAAAAGKKTLRKAKPAVMDSSAAPGARSVLVNGVVKVLREEVQPLRLFEADDHMRPGTPAQELVRNRQRRVEGQQEQGGVGLTLDHLQALNRSYVQQPLEGSGVPVSMGSYHPLNEQVNVGEYHRGGGGGGGQEQGYQQQQEVQSSAAAVNLRRRQEPKQNDRDRDSLYYF